MEANYPIFLPRLVPHIFNRRSSTARVTIPLSRSPIPMVSAPATPAAIFRSRSPSPMMTTTPQSPVPTNSYTSTTTSLIPDLSTLTNAAQDIPSPVRKGSPMSVSSDPPHQINIPRNDLNTDLHVDEIERHPTPDFTHSPGLTPNLPPRSVRELNHSATVLLLSTLASSSNVEATSTIFFNFYRRNPQTALLALMESMASGNVNDRDIVIRLLQQLANVDPTLGSDIITDFVTGMRGQ